MNAYDRAQSDDAGSDDNSLAIIGMAGRFPGAADIDAFWALLRDGREGLTRFSPDEAALLDPGQAHDPAYVPAKGVLADAELFDAAFFGIAPFDAVLLDPQQRLFLQTCWTAMEDAGHPARTDPDHDRDAVVGVYASASLNGYWMQGLGRGDEDRAGFHSIAAIDKDFLASRVAYHLDLTGPAIGVQTACSSSLVAVHIACQALLAGDCDIAIAGGVSVTMPLRAGYVWQPGGIASPDGHCLPFCDNAAGTLNGDGVAAVVIRRLADALADGDIVRAVILGSAVTNDGRRRAGFAAPGVEGQARAIRLAQGVAGITPGSVGYVEGHGTATHLGDAIELQALAEAFGRHGTAGAEPPLLGSVKANIGHLDAAAGVAGLIKTVLALQHDAIPPSHAGERDHPGLAASGFARPLALRHWPYRPNPRRAGVSSFGLGGTDAHVVLQEAPAWTADRARSAAAGPWPLVLAARSRPALGLLMSELHGWLAAHPDASLADVAYTLASGRSRHAWQLRVDCCDHAGALRALAAMPPIQAELVAWPSLPQGRRLRLPTYPFEGVRYWLTDGHAVAATPSDLLAPAQQLQAAGWRSRQAPPPRVTGPWLIIADGPGEADALQQALAQAGPVMQTPSASTSAAMCTMKARQLRPAVIACLLPSGRAGVPLGQAAVGLPALLQTLADAEWLDGVTLLLVTCQSVAVGGERWLDASQAGLHAAALTLMAEHPGLACAVIDLGEGEDAAACVPMEAAATESLVAWRHGRRWVRDWEILPSLPQTKLRHRGVWIITGGTGGIGLLVACHLARHAQARLLLVGRAPDPRNPALAAAAAIIAEAGGDVEFIACDLADPSQAAGLVAQALARFGALHGIIHAAGLADGGMVQRLSQADVQRHLAIKPAAAMALARGLAGRALDHFVLFGSHAGSFGAFGQYAYAAANGALSAVAETLRAAGRPEAFAIAWDRWQQVGMAAAAEQRHRATTGQELPGGLHPDAALSLLDRALAEAGRPGSAEVLLATTRPPCALAAERNALHAAMSGPASMPGYTPRQPRPADLPPRIEADTLLGRQIIAIWEEQLGIAPLGVTDDFILVGGDSLTALRLAGAMKSRLGLTVGLRDLMAARTVAGLLSLPSVSELAPTAGGMPAFVEEEL